MPLCLWIHNCIIHEYTDLSGQFFPRIAQNPVFAHKHELDGQSKGQRETSNTEDQQSWCYRAPPRGLASEEYVLCKR